MSANTRATTRSHRGRSKRKASAVVARVRSSNIRRRAARPPKVDYRLTARGGSLAEALAVIDQWVIAHFFDMAGARDRYLRKKRRTPALEAGA